MRYAFWKRHKNKLFEAQGRHFEREVLKLSRFRYPDLVQTRSQSALDRSGIDLVARDKKQAIKVAVQCKGFEVVDPGPTQYADIKHSIDSFLSSKYTAAHFVVAYNRDGRHRDFERKIQKLLAELIKSGKCKQTTLLNLNQLQSAFARDLRDYLEVALAESARARLTALRNTFEAISEPRSVVPMTERLLWLQPGGAPEVSLLEDSAERSIFDIVRPRSEARYTLLIGTFGLGKTTAALMAAARRDAQHAPIVIYAECSRLSPATIGSGLNALLQTVLDVNGVFDKFPATESNEFIRLAAPLFRALLGNRGEKLGADHQYALVLDGLDENRLFSTVEGISILTNSLGDLFCPIILTTRREHFFSTFGSMAIGLTELGSKQGSRRPIRICELDAWTANDVAAYVGATADGLRNKGRDSAAAKVLTLKELIEAGEDQDFYGSMVTHPLFLHLILDDVVEHGVRQQNRVGLLSTWAEYKIHRDIKKRSQTSHQGWHFEPNFVQGVMRFMEAVAASLTEDGPSGTQLKEQITSEELVELASGHFPENADGAVSIMLNSLLVPVDLKSDGRFNAVFVFRIYQEFFLARHAVRQGSVLDISGTAVAALADELRLNGFAASDKPTKTLL